MSILTAFIGGLVEHGLDMVQDKDVLKENLRRPSSLASYAAFTGAVTMPADDPYMMLAQGLSAVIGAILFLYRKP